MSLKPSQKLQVIELINENPKVSNKGLASALQITASQVSSVRYWYAKKGASYVEKIELEKQEVEKEIQSINKLYAEVSNKFKNVAGKGKKEARQIMANWIEYGKKHNGLNSGTIATLPSNTWAIEDIIYNTISKRFNYLACELKSEVFVEMVSKMNHYGKKNIPHLGKLSDVILNAKQDEFDHIIADYCGVLSSFKDELIHACLNNVVKVGGTISVTTLKARNEKSFTTKINQFHSEVRGFGFDSELSNNENAIRMFFKSLSAITNFEVVEEFCYNDTTPMMLVVLRRTK